MASTVGHRWIAAPRGPERLSTNAANWINELNWKPWKNARDLATNREERLFEMADIFHFFVQLALDQGFSASEIYSAYIAKNDENRRRQQSDPRYRPASSDSDVS